MKTAGSGNALPRLFTYGTLTDPEIMEHVNGGRQGDYWPPGSDRNLAARAIKVRHRHGLFDRLRFSFVDIPTTVSSLNQSIIDPV